MTDEDEVEVRLWVKRGPMMVNTSALDIDDPDHIYNQIRAQGKAPQDYGIEHPWQEEFGNKSRGELMAEIVDLRKELNIMHRESARW